MSDLTDQIAQARAKWKYRGDIRPEYAVNPEKGQESVWDYPRPPKIDPDKRTVVVKYESELIAESTGTVRILETSSPPVFYIPEKDIELSLLKEGTGSSLCEWKGNAKYWDVITEIKIFENAAWSYPEPFPGYEEIRDYISFYPSMLECYVDGERVLPQQGGYYGGWVTTEIVGPYKGEPGTGGW
ncbi:MAG: DUF427 domain-containing protein [Thermodesulfobacteriota bacterium]